MDFPHISDTKFPDIKTVDVYKYRNNFDYGRWTGKISLKLCNVLWNNDYSDVVCFESDNERDNWFDAQHGLIVTLESAFNITPENTVKIPIPYNDAYRYNYLVVDMPMQTSTNEPLDYEVENLRVKRWYYFIDNMTQTAPSTTELELTLDIWTMFINTVNIPYLMLERGHAPMKQTTVENFLANPIDNCEYLLADDFNYGNVNRVVKESTYFPVGSGNKYVLFAIPIEVADFPLIGGAEFSGDSTPPTFDSIPDGEEGHRWGYQLIVNGYEWKYGKANYSNANMPTKSMLNQDSVFNGNIVYAIECVAAKDFFTELANEAVHMLHAIQGVFVVAEDMIDFEYEFDFRGYHLSRVRKQYATYDLELNKNAFGFDDKYKEIAKLYTYPYSVLEITDDNGFTSEVRIENTGHMQFHKELSIAFPYVRYQVFFTGLNGDKTLDYIWRDLNNQNVSKTMWEDDFSSYMMNWDIPTYAVFVNSEQEYAVNNFASNQAKRLGAIVDYENATRYANTNRENVYDTMETNETNVNASSATNVANVSNTGDTNVTNVNATGSTNVQNVADSGATNTQNTTDSNNTMQFNTNESMGQMIANTANKNTVNTDVTDRANQQNQELTDLDIAERYIDISVANAIAAESIQNNINNAVASTLGSAANAIGGTVGGMNPDFAIGENASSGLGVFGAAATITGFMSSAITGMSIVANNANYVNNVNQIQLDAFESANGRKELFKSKNESIRDCASEITRLNNEMAMTINENVQLVTNENARRVKEMNIANASRTQQTNNTNETRMKNTNNYNANRIKDTNNQNAQRTAETDNDNIGRTKATENENARQTGEATITAAQQNLIQKQREIEATYKNARLGNLTAETFYSGDAYPDVFERRGVRMNIRTQSKSAIAQTGDAMLRFGYALHRAWDMTRGFHYGNHFTFWKAEDIWINEGNGIVGNAVNMIGDILMKGVTVWSNPDEIGKISIYDNM